MKRIHALLTFAMLALLAGGWVIKDTANNVDIYTGSNTTPTISANTTGAIALGPTGATTTTTANGNLTVTRSSGDTTVQALATSTTGATSLLLRDGDNTTSARKTYVQFRSDETSPQSWIAGMNAVKDWHLENVSTGLTSLSVNATTDASTIGPPNLNTQHTVNGQQVTITNGSASATDVVLKLNTGNAAGRPYFVLQNTGVDKGYLASQGSGAAFVTGAAQNDMLMVSNTAGAKLLFSAGAAAAIDASIDSSGIVTARGGVKFPTSGGTATTLDYFETGSQTMTFDGVGFAASQSITVTWQKIGKWVCMNFPAKTAAGAASGAVKIATTAALTARLQPTNSIDMAMVNVIDNGVNVGPGIFDMNTSGVVGIFRNFNATTAFTNSATIGWGGFNVCWNTN